MRLGAPDLDLARGLAQSTFNVSFLIDFWIHSRVTSRQDKVIIFDILKLSHKPVRQIDINVNLVPNDKTRRLSGKGKFSILDNFEIFDLRIFTIWIKYYCLTLRNAN